MTPDPRVSVHDLTLPNQSGTLEARARRILAGVADPHSGTDLVASGALKGIGVMGKTCRSMSSSVIRRCRGKPTRRIPQAGPRSRSGDRHTRRSACPPRPRAPVQEGLTPLPNVKNIIAVASGKGGVGKSTVAANLALALAAEGASVGVLDADIYGPSQPRMLGISGKPEFERRQASSRRRNHGIQAMSIGFMIDEDTPMIWRGPMVTQALQQLLGETNWTDLDYLIIDLPPGTGDIQLTLCQRVPVSGALIVTTPQDIALLDAKKALKMFEKVNVPVLGIIENMATHVCSQCGHEEHMFGAGGGARMAEQYDVPLLGSLPLDIRIREQADGGTPTVVAMPDSDIAGALSRDRAQCSGAPCAARAEQGDPVSEDRHSEHLKSGGWEVSRGTARGITALSPQPLSLASVASP